MSLDGFIAGPNPVVDELIPQVGALLGGAEQPVVPGHSPLNSGGRLANIAVMPSVRSLLGRNAEFHAAT
jgi:hypothetical protein